MVEVCTEKILPLLERHMAFTDFQIVPRVPVYLVELLERPETTMGLGVSHLVRLDEVSMEKVPLQLARLGGLWISTQYRRYGCIWISSDGDGNNLWGTRGAQPVMRVEVSMDLLLRKPEALMGYGVHLPVPQGQGLWKSICCIRHYLWSARTIL